MTAITTVAVVPIYLSCPDARGTPKVRFEKSIMDEISIVAGNEKTCGRSKFSVRVANNNNGRIPRTLILKPSTGPKGIPVVLEESGNYGRLDLHPLRPCSKIKGLYIDAQVKSNGELHIEIPKYVKFEDARNTVFKEIPSKKKQDKIVAAASINPYERGPLHAFLYKELCEHEVADQDTTANIAISIVESLLDKLPRAFGHELIEKVK